MTIATRPQPEHIEIPEGTPQDLARVLEAIQKNFEVLFRDSLQLGEESGASGEVSLTANSVELGHIETIASDRLLGRDTAATGNVEELTVTGGVEFSGSGGIRRSALTGDVTAAAGSNATTIANDAVTTAKVINDAVTYAKMQNVSAASRLLGRGSAGGAGDVEEITLGTGLAMTTTTVAVTTEIANSAWDFILTKSSDQDVTNSTAFVDETDLQLSVTAGDVWLLQYLIVYSATDSSRDFKLEFAHTAGSVGTSVMGSSVLTGVSTTDGVVNSAVILGGALAQLGTAATHGKRFARLDVVMSVQATGTWKIRFAQVTAALATESRFCQGSVFRGLQVV